MDTILSCSDSRVSPITIFNKSIGKIFEISTPGNILTENTLQYILFGVNILKTPIVIVMGHTDCGAMKALSDYDTTKYILSDLTSIYPTYLELKEHCSSHICNDISSEMVYENVKKTIQLLKTNSSIQPLIQEGKVVIIGMVYNIYTGLLDVLPN